MGGQSKLAPGLLPNEKVQALFKAYGKGKDRRPLQQCATSFMNRAISGKYCHSKLREILEVEGFSSERYKYAVAAEPSEKDPMQNTRRMVQEVEDSAGMLPKVVNDKQPLIGFLTKNHLLLAMLILADGRIKKDHDAENSWTRPMGDKESGRHQELFEVLDRGL